MHFSQVVEATADKHKKFAEQVEARDMEIFFYIPSLLVLISLDEDDKNICRYFYPDLYDADTKTGEQFLKLKGIYKEGQSKVGNNFNFYNLLEKTVIELELADPEEKRMFAELNVDGIVREIKGLAMSLSRFKPQDWNKFLDVVIK